MDVDLLFEVSWLIVCRDIVKNERFYNKGKGFVVVKKEDKKVEGFFYLLKKLGLNIRMDKYLVKKML